MGALVITIFCPVTKLIYLGDNDNDYILKLDLKSIRLHFNYARGSLMPIESNTQGELSTERVLYCFGD